MNLLLLFRVVILDKPKRLLVKKRNLGGGGSISTEKYKSWIDLRCAPRNFVSNFLILSHQDLEIQQKGLWFHESVHFLSAVLFICDFIHESITFQIKLYIWKNPLLPIVLKLCRNKLCSLMNRVYSIILRLKKYDLWHLSMISSAHFTAGQFPKTHRRKVALVLLQSHLFVHLLDRWELLFEVVFAGFNNSLCGTTKSGRNVERKKISVLWHWIFSIHLGNV